MITSTRSFLRYFAPLLSFHDHIRPILKELHWLPVAKQLAPVVQRLDNAIHRINHYPADSVVCFVHTYPLDSDLSGG